MAAALVEVYGASTYAINGEDSEIYYDHIESVLNSRPHLTTDDGADLVSTLHTDRTDVIDGVMGGTEETTTGVIRLRAMAEQGVLKYPIVAVNEAMTKHMFDNRYGTGQSTLDGVVRATNLLLAGRTVVVGGYGWCGRGMASRAAGMGAHLIVTEVDRSAHSKPSWTATASCPCRKPPPLATCSSPSPATSTSSTAPTSRS